MKIKPETYQRIEAAIQCVIHSCNGPEALRNMYRNQTTTRLVWDVFWATNNSRQFYHELSASSHAEDHSDNHIDNHIEAVLTRICKQHGLIPE